MGTGMENILDRRIMDGKNSSVFFFFFFLNVIPPSRFSANFSIMIFELIPSHDFRSNSFIKYSTGVAAAEVQIIYSNIILVLH
ncbi:hypothetical protein QL285_094175 [Trifolium repens]|nr:hypothetical protein QL285_094175 [Trifolium repens]